MRESLSTRIMDFDQYYDAVIEHYYVNPKQEHDKDGIDINAAALALGLCLLTKLDDIQEALDGKDPEEKHWADSNWQFSVLPEHQLLEIVKEIEAMRAKGPDA